MRVSAVESERGWMAPLRGAFVLVFTVTACSDATKLRSSLESPSGSESLLYSDAPAVFPEDSAPGAEFVRSVLHPTVGEVDAARNTALEMRRQFAAANESLQATIENTIDDRLLDVIGSEFVASERWPQDLRSAVGTAVASARESGAAWHARALLADSSDAIVARLDADEQAPFVQRQIVLTHLLRFDPTAAVAAGDRVRRDTWRWPGVRERCLAVAGTNPRPQDWLNAAMADFDSYSRWQEPDPRAYCVELLVWRAFDAAADDAELGAVVLAIGQNLLRPSKASGPPTRRVETLTVAARLLASGADPAARSSARIALAFEFTEPAEWTGVEDLPWRDDRVAATLLEAVAFENANRWAHAVVRGGELLRRLGEPQRAIDVLSLVLEPAVDAATNDTKSYFRSGPTPRHEAAIELSRSYELLGDRAKALEWMKRVESLGPVWFDCGLYGDGWRSALRDEVVRLEEAVRGEK